jgi:hypothetical protein
MIKQRHVTVILFKACYILEPFLLQQIGCPASTFWGKAASGEKSNEEAGPAKRHLSFKNTRIVLHHENYTHNATSQSCRRGFRLDSMQQAVDPSDLVPSSLICATFPQNRRHGLSTSTTTMYCYIAARGSLSCELRIIV